MPFGNEEILDMIRPGPLTHVGAAFPPLPGVLVMTSKQTMQHTSIRTKDTCKHDKITTNELTHMHQVDNKIGKQRATDKELRDDYNTHIIPLMIF